MAENDSRESEYFLLGLILAALVVLLWNRFSHRGLQLVSGGGSGGGNSSSGGCGCGGGGSTVLSLGTNSFDSAMAGFKGSVPSPVVAAQNS
jgi:hypothetical protein